MSKIRNTIIIGVIGLVLTFWELYFHISQYQFLDMVQV